MIRAHVPRSLEEAVRVLAQEPRVRPIAGGTDLMVGGAGLAVDAVMDLTRIPEIRGVERAGAEWRIGAATTFTEIQRAPGLREGLPALAEAASWVGGWQIQNRATLGGNMANASPAGDSLPVLLVLDAEVVMVGPRGTRSIPYARFHVDYRRTALGPDEIIGWVRIPVPAPGTVQRFRKVGTREAQSISKVVVAMAARPHEGRLERVRLAAGSVAPIPVRLPAVESACEGGRPGEALAERAAEAAMDSVTPIDDVRSTAIYRKHVLGRVVRRMVLHMALRG